VSPEYTGSITWLLKIDCCYCSYRIWIISWKHMLCAFFDHSYDRIFRICCNGINVSCFVLVDPWSVLYL